MEYSISMLSKLAGVSARALHYYDEIGLLKPSRSDGNGYRVYGRKEVDLLQQILFFRELGISLAEIKKVLYAKDFDSTAALHNHLSELKQKRSRIDLLIANVEKTISAVEGDIVMDDREKFLGFKKKLIEENENKYGAEIRTKYGDAAVDASNEKLYALTGEQYSEAEELSRRINEALKEAFEEGDPSGARAREVCDMHKKWLGFFWTGYSKEAHLGLAQTYVEDPRFTAYYDENVAPGSAGFLLEAMKFYCG